MSDHLNRVHQAAREAHAAGVCIIPPAEDGTKRPLPNPTGAWDRFKAERPTVDELRSWYPGRGGLGVVIGMVSGRVECWDFDDRDAYQGLLAAAAKCGLGDVVARVEAGYTDDTPAGGVRWLARYHETVEREPTGIKLARRPKTETEKKHPKDNIKTLIELPAFAITAPSNGLVHDTGKPYVRRSGGFGTIAAYSVEERDALLELARSFDDMPRAEAAPQPPRQANGIRPGDDYAARTSWPEILEPAGWRRVFERSGVTYWRRPGKKLGLSATTNYAGSDLLYVFTSSTEFEPEKSYSKFAAFAMLEHRGDYRAAAAALGSQGYGQQVRPTVTKNTTGSGPAEEGPTPFSVLDLSILDRVQIEAPPFPLIAFGERLSTWISETASAASAPDDYVAIATLTGSSGLISARRWVSPWAGWEEPCIIWAVPVGPPSANKSPALDPIRRAIGAAEEHKAQGHDEAAARYEADLSTSKAVKRIWEKQVEAAIAGKKPIPDMPKEAIEPKKPVKPRCWISNVTIDKAARLLAEQPGGLLAIYDELAALVGSFDRYGGSGGDRAFWLSSFGGRPDRLDRVKDGSIDVPANALSILGLIQPDRLNTLVLSGDNDGFASRPLYAWPEPRQRKKPKKAPDRTFLENAFKKLVELDYGTSGKVLPLAVDAMEAFQLWWEGSHSRDIDAASGVLSEAFSKMSGGALRVALALEYLWWATEHGIVEPQEISFKAIGHALTIIDNWAKPMARRVLSEAAIPKSQRQAMSLARWIKSTGVLDLNARTTLRKHRGDLPGIVETQDMDEACATLIDAGWLRPAGARAGETKGRRTKAFSVNPAVHAKSEEAR